jgi:hypothetical protein
MTIVQGGAVVFDAAELHHEGEDTHVFAGGINGGGGDGFLTFRKWRGVQARKSTRRQPRS